MLRGFHCSESVVFHWMSSVFVVLVFVCFGACLFSLSENIRLFTFHLVLFFLFLSRCLPKVALPKVAAPSSPSPKVALCRALLGWCHLCFAAPRSAVPMRRLCRWRQLCRCMFVDPLLNVSWHSPHYVRSHVSYHYALLGFLA